MSLGFEPVAPWYWVSAACALLAALLLAAGIATQRVPLAASPRAHRAAALLNPVVAMLLVLATCSPVLRQHQQILGSHLALVVDVSDSVQRAAPGRAAPGRTAPGRAAIGWPEIRRTLQQRLQQVVDRIDRATAQRSSCSIVVCARGSRTVVARQDLASLPVHLSRLDQRQLPVGDASDIASGLQEAAELIASAGGRGVVVLVSDGHQTRGDALMTAEELASRGVAVDVLPLAGKSPEIGIYAADLPPNVDAGTETYARVFLVNRSHQAIGIDLRTDAASDGGGGELGLQRRVELPAGAQWISLRQPVQFEEAGIRSLDLELWSEGEQRLHRRFFTLVTSPPRLLAVGDTAWAQALPAGRFEVTAQAAEHLASDLDPSRFDLVVLNGVPADRLPPLLAGRLALAMRRRGTGLLLVNGPHWGGQTAPSLLMSYDHTPLEPLSPLIARPRPLLPVTRQVVIMIDASGSMSGWALAKEKEIAAYIISQLRDTDRLDLIAFTSTALHLIDNQPATAQTRELALKRLGSVSAAGGTDPSEALRLIAGRRFTECGLFFLSDGQFARLALRPDCQATVFAIGHRQRSMPRVLAELAEPFPVDPSFNPASVRICYLDPHRRKYHYEPGSFRPIDGIDAVQGGWTMLPDPAQYLQGNAVTHAREGAEMAAIRPRLTDPILAFKDNDAGSMGVFTSDIPDTYLSRSRQTIVPWLERLLSFSARDRYGITVTDQGVSLGLQVTLLATAGAVDRLSVRLESEGGDSSAVTLRPHPELAGVFVGNVPWPLARGKAGALVVTESGPDALPRPQRIPLALPPPAQRLSGRGGSEAWSHGLNEGLLRAIAAAGGGSYDPSPEQPLLHGGTAVTTAIELRPILLVLAALVYLAQITVRRLGGA